MYQRKSKFQYRPNGIGDLFLVCPLEGLGEQETCPDSPWQASFQTSVGKLNTHCVIFAEGSFCKLNFINQNHL